MNTVSTFAFEFNQRPCDLEGDMRLMSVKMEALETFISAQKLPRLQDITPEIPEAEIQLNNKDVLGSGGKALHLSTFSAQLQQLCTRNHSTHPRPLVHSEVLKLSWTGD